MPDLDPRLAACALAVGPLLASGSPAEIARAAVEEWLSHPATLKMRQESRVHISTADFVYAAMCAQAAKEIAG